VETSAEVVQSAYKADASVVTDFISQVDHVVARNFNFNNDKPNQWKPKQPMLINWGSMIINFMRISSYYNAYVSVSQLLPKYFSTQ